MIGISKLYCGQVEPSDALRYGRESGNLPSHLLQFSKDKKPVVVWNMTKRCNLKCVHCYAQAVPVDGADDISTEQAKTMIDDLAAYGAPVMLFSGGEPLVRKDLVELASHATSKGMRAVISTNGTLITKEKARELKGVGLSYVGISLDGMEEVHDRFRGVPGEGELRRAVVAGEHFDFGEGALFADAAAERFRRGLFGRPAAGVKGGRFVAAARLLLFRGGENPVPEGAAEALQ